MFHFLHVANIFCSFEQEVDDDGFFTALGKADPYIGYHVATGLYIAAGLAYTPDWHVSTHVSCNFIHRGMAEMSEDVLSEWIS